MHKPKKEVVKVLLTGGHAATTALAVVQEIKHQRLPWNLHWVGTKSAFSGLKSQTFEMKILPEYSVAVHQIVSGKIIKQPSLNSIGAFLKIPIGFIHAFGLIRKLKPTVTLSFGGSVALSVVVASWLMGIPVIVQEQVRGIGWANKLSAYFAKKVAISFEETKRFVDSKKVVFAGSPLTRQTLALSEKTKKHTPTRILVTGGSRGAQNVNTIVFDSLERLLPNFEVKHLTGELDYTKGQEVLKKLPSDISKNYQVYEVASPDAMSELYDWADILVGRSGANTVAETLYLHLPAVFIPIPWS